MTEFEVLDEIEAKVEDLGGVDLEELQPRRQLGICARAQGRRTMLARGRLGMM